MPSQESYGKFRRAESVWANCYITDILTEMLRWLVYWCMGDYPSIKVRSVLDRLLSLIQCLCVVRETAYTVQTIRPIFTTHITIYIWLQTQLLFWAVFWIQFILSSSFIINHFIISLFGQVCFKTNIYVLWFFCFVFRIIKKPIKIERHQIRLYKRNILQSFQL